MALKQEGLREMVQLQRRMNQLFEEMLRPGEAHSSVPAYNWTPPADVYEDGRSYYVELELPGVSIEEVQVTCDGSTLKVAGNRKPGIELSRETVQRMERTFGPFSREFTFPEDLDPERVKANLKDGVLVIEVARKNRRRTIKVK
jgi:HSP20 family protein